MSLGSGGRGKEMEVERISQHKNRKKNATEVEGSDEVQHNKCQILGDLHQLVTILVEAATQPHHEL